MQTKDGYPAGNCLMACVASILECSIDDLPDLGDETHDGTWWALMRGALRDRGYEPVYTDVDPEYLRPPGFHLVYGNIRGSSCGHVLVAKDGLIVHDPHPRRPGVERIHGWILLIPRVAA